MRLTALTIKNFKGIDERGVRIEFAPITLLFGPNNVGKSTILHALLYAREVLTKNNADPDSLAGAGANINLGGFYNFVHKHEITRTISLRFDFDIDEMPEYFVGSDIDNISRSFDTIYLFASIKNIGVECLISYDTIKNQSFFDNYIVYINDKKFCDLKLDHERGHVVFSGCNSLCLIDPFDELDFLLSLKDALILSEGERSKKIESAVEKYRNSVPDLLKTLHRDDYLFAETADVEPDIAGEFIKIQHKISFAFTRGIPFDWYSIIPISIETLEEADEDLLHGGQTEFYDLQRSVLSSLILGPGKLLTEELERLLYIGPLRAIPQRNFQPACSPDINRWANGLAAWDMLATATNDQLKAVNHRLNNPDFLTTGYTIARRRSLPLDADGPLALALRQSLLEDFDENSLPLLRAFLEQSPEIRVVLRNENTGVEVEPHDMGVGISQIIPIVVAAVFSKHDALITIEQPELHIHPAWQTTLGDIFIQAIHRENPPIFLLETHSEHLLLRLLRRIRNTHKGTATESTRLAHTDIAVHWIGTYEGRTEIYRLGLDEDGSFNTPWPEGFFDERGEELFG